MKRTQQSKQLMTAAYRYALVFLLSLYTTMTVQNANAELPPQQLKFTHLSSKQGLAQNTVRALTQDNQGFVWISTQSGLHRYDGYRFQNYNHNPQDENSISSNLVVALTTDKDGSLWAATLPAAINKFNPVNGNFTSTPFPLLETRGFIHQLHSADKLLWIAIDNQFFVLNKSQQTLIAVKTPDKMEDEAIAILEDETKNIWLVKETGLYSVKQKDLNIDKKITLELTKNERISSATLNGNVFYLGTNQSNLYRYSIEKSTLEKIWSLSDEKKIGASSIFTSMALSKSNLWITSNSNGLIKYSLHDNTASIFTHDSKISSSIAENNLQSILIDNSDLIWLGTTASGVERTTGESKPFALYQDRADDNNFILHNDIRTYLLTQDNEYWLATNEGVLKHFFPETNKYENFFPPKTKIDVKANIGPAALVETSSGKILYGSKYGTWKFSPTEKRFSKLNTKDVNGINGEAVLSFYKDKKGRIWAGSSNAGVGLYDEPSEQITWFPSRNENFENISNFILILEQAEEQLLWVGSSKGLAFFNTNTLKYQKLNLSNDNNPLQNSVIRTLHQTPQGILWVGTLSGVFSLQKIQGNWLASHRFTEIKSLSSNIYAFLSDGSGNLWISSNFGLTKVNPGTGEFKDYSSDDGLQGEEFNGNVAFKSTDGRLWFGGLNGLNAFYPDSITTSNFKPPIWITGYQIDDRFFKVENPEFFSKLVLPAKTQFLKLYFSSLDYTQTDRNQYKIKNNNSEEEWIELGNTHEIAYTQLQPGSYRMCLIGSNHNGIWNPSCRSLLVILEPPYWKTNIAYFIYIIIFSIISVNLFYTQKRKTLSKLRVHNEILNSKKQLRWALDGSGDALWIWDVKTGKAHRQGINQLLGYKPGEFQNIDSEFESLIHPEDLISTQQYIAQNIRDKKNEFHEIEYRLKTASGGWMWVLDRGKIVERDEENQLLTIAGTFRDISNRKKSEEESQLSALIIRNMAEMVLVTDENFRILSANPSWCNKMGYQFHELIGKDPSIFNCSEQPLEFYESARNHLLKFGSWQGEMPQKKKNAQIIMNSLEMTVIKNSDQSIRHIVAVCTDITEKKKAEEELRYLANYDTLTNLPNRTLFLDRIEHAILQSQRNKNTIALLFIDLDNFKNINDTLGHSYGDLLLKESAQIITHCVRKDDTVSRLGGDEFTVIIENVNDGVSVFHIAEKILESFADTIQIGERMVSITPSIGISLYPNDAANASQLVQFADTAMYFAKSQGRNNFQFYAEEMNQNALRRLEIEGHLRTALENQEFHVAYQPKVNTISGKITGMEALIRWNNPVIGSISPVEFIPFAEDSGLIVAIGEWILLNACLQAKKWIDNDDTDLNLSVNLSYRQFKDLDLPEIVERVLQQTKLRGQNLTLEITESLLMDNVEKAIQQLKQLKLLGVKIAIDDFGTGYSSLNYLKQFPLDFLKIDRTFVNDVLTNQNDASLTSAIIALSHNLELSVIAEGVELVEQLAFLREAGCEEIQGFLVSQPIDAVLFGKLLKQSKNKNIFKQLQKKS